MRLIGLNGRLHSGKGAVCELIGLTRSKQPVTEIAFSHLMKVSAMASLGVKLSDMDAYVRAANQFKETGTVTVDLDNDTGYTITGREYLQCFGTEGHREVFGTYFWIDALLPTGVEKLFDDEDIVVISDLRFADEAARVLELGGEVWHIDAEKRLGPLPDDAHESEYPLADELITWRLDNNGTLGELMAGVGAALDHGQALRLRWQMARDTRY